MNRPKSDFLSVRRTARRANLRRSRGGARGLILLALVLGAGACGAQGLSAPHSLLTTQTPAMIHHKDGPTTGYELGVRFKSDATGEIRAIRFWRDLYERGTHVGRIWSATGTQLATVTFNNETASGWQAAGVANAAPDPGQRRIHGKRQHGERLLRCHQRLLRASSATVTWPASSGATAATDQSAPTLRKASDPRTISETSCSPPMLALALPVAQRRTPTESRLGIPVMSESRKIPTSSSRTVSRATRRRRISGTSGATTIKLRRHASPPTRQT